MTKIDVDQEVFEFLQKNAVPLVDTPNAVLRRLLRIDKVSSPTTKEAKSTMTTTSNTQSMDTYGFVRIVLDKEFPEGCQRKSPYRFMFEAPNALIYFQNFNWKILKAS